MLGVVARSNPGRVPACRRPATDLQLIFELLVNNDMEGTVESHDPNE